MGKTIVEKIIQQHTRAQIEKNKLVIIDIDKVMITDSSAELAINEFKDLQTEIKSKENIIFVLDHNSPASDPKTSSVQQKIRAFAGANNARLFDIGCGICHQLMLENGYVFPGSIIIAGEAHSSIYGALNAIGIGVGASDLAAVMATGKMWSVIPGTIFIDLRGKFPPHTNVRDLVFHLISMFKLEYSHVKNYCIEFGGEAVADLTIPQRLSICSLATEMGATTAIMPFDAITQAWVEKNNIKNYTPVNADKDAKYLENITVHLEEIRRMLAIPHSIENIDYVSKIKDVKVDQAVLGACAAGQLEDYEKAAAILKGRKVKSRLLIIPSSSAILRDLINTGILNIFLDAGAIILPPGCGPCSGTNVGMVSAGEVVISTTKINYRGTMGSMDSFVYLASPEVVAASAVAGKIITPEELK